MRIKNSLRNVYTSILSNVLNIFIGLLSQAIFIKILGSEYLGFNSFFSNIISMLSIVEMGIGSAIIYNLYNPIANNNIEDIKSLMIFYKKSYRIIAIIISIIGISIIPILPFFININSVTVNINIYLVYILFLVDTIFSYFLSYKRSILYANQKNYIINLIHILYTVFMNLFQLLILIFIKDYYLYLLVKIFMRIVENIAITIVANRIYPYLKEKNINKLDKKIEYDILKKVKALFCHKVGTFIVLGSDNIIISKFLGINIVGLYSNYYLIINSVQNIFGQIIQSTTASIGNMLVTDKKEKQYTIFKRIRFLNFWISTFTSISILVITESFITIWIGKKYILPTSVLIVLVINYYFNSSRATYNSFKDAAGIYYEDRYIPLVESFINILVSIFLVKKIGLPGVFIGTIISGLVLWCYSYPIYVYKKLFNKKYFDYIKETLEYLLLFLLLGTFTYILSNIINFNNIYFNLIYDVLIAFLIPNLIMILLFYKNDNFKFYLRILKSKNKD